MRPNFLYCLFCSRYVKEKCIRNPCIIIDHTEKELFDKIFNYKKKMFI